MCNRNWLTCLLFFILTFHLTAQETPDLEWRQSIASTEGLPSSLVNRCVCAITGEYIDQSLDISIPGPEPLSINRIYSSQNNAGTFGMGWGSNHRDCVRVKEGSHEGKKKWFFWSAPKQWIIIHLCS